MKKVRITITAVTLLCLLMTMQVWAMPELPAAAQEHRMTPVQAADVTIVKKVTIKGGASAKPSKSTAGASGGELGTALPPNGTRYAIVIGVSDYPGTSSDLEYGKSDALRMRDVLLDQGFNAQNIILLTNDQATDESIAKAITEMRKGLNANDELVFYFSGHGAKGRANDGDTIRTDQSIVVWDTGEDAGGFAYLWDGQLKSWFDDFPTSRIIFAFDSCLSGGMSVLKETGRIVNMGSTTTGYSYEGDQWGGGQFTWYFAVQGIGQKAAAGVNNTPGIATVEEAFDYTKANCIYQTPTIADGFEKDLQL